MKIYGFQKTTLLDFPGRVACTVFTGGCNFRCPFCHNASLVLRPGENEPFSEDEILSYINKRKGILDGVCVTGGEPLLNDDIEPFLRKIKDSGLLVKLDTNGSFPDKLISLVNSGVVDYVAMDIKNSPEKYAITAGVPNMQLNNIKKSVSFLLSNAVDYEFRTTAALGLHTASDFTDIGKFISGAKRYFIQAYKDSGDIISSGFAPLSAAEYQKCLENVRPFVKMVQLRGID